MSAARTHLLKRLAAILITSAAVLALLAVAAYFLAKKYEPEVRDIVIFEVNRKLDTEVRVEDINLSLIQRFPYASLRFSKVVIPEVNSGSRPDTLLYAEDVYLQISLWDFLRKHYRISEADVNNGFFRMRINADGTGNYKFWKDTDGDAASLISLNDIEAENFDFSLRNASGTDLQLRIRRAGFRGSFGSEVYDLASECRLTVNHFSEKGDTLYRDLPVSGKFEMLINHLTGLHELRAAGLTLGREKFNIAGRYEPERGEAWHLRIAAEGAEIANAVNLLPLQMRSTFAAYRASGRSDLVLEAENAADQPFRLDFLFDRTRGSFRHDQTPGAAKVDDAAGSLQMRGDRLSLYIDRAEGSIGPGKLSISGSIRNFDAPEFNLSVSGDAMLREVRDFFNPEFVSDMSGAVHLSGTFSGKLPARAQGAALLRGVDFDGVITARDAALKIRGGDTYFEKVNGEITLRDNAFAVENASAEVNGNAFSFSGEIANALPYLFREGESLFISADFSADDIDLNRIWNASASQRDTTYKFSLPELTEFDFRLNVGRVTFRRFAAEEISGRATYAGGKLELNPIRFRAAGGRAAGSARAVKQSADTYLTSARFALADIDISGLFYAFENFGQVVIKSDQISGRTDAGVNFSGLLRDDLSYDLNSVRASAELELVNGKLRNVEALNEVAAFMAGHPVWKSLVKTDVFSRKLAEVEFDTLRNTIEIADRTVSIPAMRVGSSALTLNVAGTHTFDHRIDYRLNFRLSELFRTGKPKGEEFGYLTDDGAGLRLFLQMSGTADDPVFNLDKEGARRKRREEFKQEKNLVKGMLKEEFGLFKSDTTAVRPPVKKEKSAPVFEVEWDEDGPNGGEKKKAKKKERKRGLFSPKNDEGYEGLDDDDDL